MLPCAHWKERGQKRVESVKCGNGEKPTKPSRKWKLYVKILLTKEFFFCLPLPSCAYKCIQGWKRVRSFAFPARNSRMIFFEIVATFFLKLTVVATLFCFTPFIIRFVESWLSLTYFGNEFIDLSHPTLMPQSKSQKNNVRETYHVFHVTCVLFSILIRFLFVKTCFGNVLQNKCSTFRHGLPT